MIALEVVLLPFMQKKPVAGLIIAKRKPDGGKEELHQEGDENHALEACAADLIRAVHAKDIKAAAEAMRSAFEILDSEPHEEGPHTNEPEAAE